MKLSNTPPNSPPIAGSNMYFACICMVASLGGLLFGFDTAVISGTVERVSGQFGLNNIQQGWFTSAALIGCIAGALGAGWLGDRFGRKPNLIVAAVLLLAGNCFSGRPRPDPPEGSSRIGRERASLRFARPGGVRGEGGVKTVFR